MLSATEKVIRNYIEGIRPPIEIRDKLDIGFSFVNNTLIVFEIVPFFMDNSKKIERPVIKAHQIAKDLEAILDEGQYEMGFV